MPADPIAIRPVEPGDLPWVRGELFRNWGTTRICSLDVWHDVEQLPGFIAVRDGRGGFGGGEGDGERLGLLTHTPLASGDGCEVVTLSSRIENSGVGTALLAAVESAARSAGCTRVFLTTTNDNLRAIGFYQKRGWRLVAVHRGAMDRAREIKPAIPRIGFNGIPMRDEIELETAFPLRP